MLPIIEATKDAWVTYPSEPLGSIWLVRLPEGAEPPLTAFTAECPHLGCAITLASDAHVPANVGRDFDRAVELARDAGYETVTVFEGRRARQEPLG